MPVFTRVISVFLLLLFVRVLVPDSFVLALHKHTHTVEKRIATQWGDQQVDTRHIHCPTDHLFHNTFYVLPAAALELPAFTHHSSSYLSAFTTVWKFTFPNNILLRGPPTVFSYFA